MNNNTLISLIKKIANTSNIKSNDEHWTAQNALLFLLAKQTPSEIGAAVKNELSVQEKIRFGLHVTQLKEYAYQYGCQTNVEALEEYLDSRHIWWTKDNFFLKQVVRWGPAILLVSYCLISFEGQFERFVAVALIAAIYMLNECQKLMKFTKKQNDLLIREIKTDELNEKNSKITSLLIEKSWLPAE